VPAAAVDLLVLGGLVGLLAVAFLHPRPSVELTGGLAVGGLLLGSGSLPWSAAGSTVHRLLPVVVFLSTSLVVAEVCAAEGVFRHLGAEVRRIGSGRPRRMLVVTTVIAALVTALLSLDATVVMLTPVVLASAGLEAQRRPLTHVCVRMANSASLLLPVSNLTNLLVLPVAGLGFVQWAALLAVPWAAVVLVEYAGVRLFFRRDLARPGSAAPVRSPGPHARDLGCPPPRFAFGVLAVMLLGFAVASVWGIEPFWVSGVAAAVLAGHALHRRTV
jgi:arsenical pump membrane protein